MLLATAACNISTSQLQKMVRTWCVFSILTSKCASRYSGVPFFSTPLNCEVSTRRFTEVTFRPSQPTNHCKTQHFATSLPFRACGSSKLSRMCIFFLAALLFQLSMLSEVRLLNFLPLFETVFDCICVLSCCFFFLTSFCLLSKRFCQGTTGPEGQSTARPQDQNHRSTEPGL